MKIKVLVSTIFISIIASSCTDNSPDDLLEKTPAPIVASYLQDVKPIMDSNCINCHGTVPTNGASISLNSYIDVKNSVQNVNTTDQLIYRISLSQGDPSQMPLGSPKLPQNKIDLIIQWKNQNFNQ